MTSTFQPNDDDQKAYRNFQKRLSFLAPLRDIQIRKMDKNFRYYIGYKGAEKFTKPEEYWRSDEFVNLTRPRVEGYLARMNARLPDVISKPRRADAVEKARKQQLALSYVLDVTKAKATFDAVKMDGLMFGTGVVATFYDDSTREVTDVLEVDAAGQALRTEARRIPYYAEPIRIERIDPYDVYLDPSHDHPDDMDDCILRFVVPLEEAREKYANFGSGYGRFLVSGMGDVTDSMASRLDMLQRLTYDDRYPRLISRDEYNSAFINKSQSRVPPDAVELLYHYQRVKDRLQIWCGNIPLLPLDTPIPFRHKMLPVSTWRNRTVNGVPYGQSEGDLLERMQDSVNNLRNGRVDAVRVSTFPITFVEPRTGMKRTSMQAGPGEIVFIKDAKGVVFSQVPPPPPQAMDEEALLRRDADLLSGFADINSGGEQRASDSATGLNIQVQSAQAQLESKVMGFEQQCFLPVLERVKHLIAEHWGEGKLIAVTGDDGVREEMVTAEDLASDTKLECKPGTGLPPNKLAIREQFLKFVHEVTSGQLFPFVVPDELIRLIGDQFEIANIDDLVAATRRIRVMKTADLENQDLLVGVPHEVREVYASEHEIHLQQHQAALERVGADPTASVAAQQTILDHIAEHQRLLQTAAPEPNPETPTPPKVSVSISGDQLTPEQRAYYLQGSPSGAPPVPEGNAGQSEVQLPPNDTQLESVNPIPPEAAMQP